MFIVFVLMPILSSVTTIARVYVYLMHLHLMPQEIMLQPIRLFRDSLLPNMLRLSKESWMQTTI